MAVEFRKVLIAAVAHPCGRHRGSIVQRLPQTRALIITKEKGLVFLDGTTHGEAELILAEFPSADTGGIVEKVIGIQFVVAQKFPEIAVELIRSALQSGIDRRLRALARRCN